MQAGKGTAGKTGDQRGWRGCEARAGVREGSARKRHTGRGARMHGGGNAAACDARQQPAPGRLRPGVGKRTGHISEMARCRSPEQLALDVAPVAAVVRLATHAVQLPKVRVPFPPAPQLPRAQGAQDAPLVPGRQAATARSWGLQGLAHRHGPRRRQADDLFARAGPEQGPRHLL